MGGRLDPTAGLDYLPAAGDRHHRGLPVPGRSGPLRRDGVAATGPRSRCRRRSADRPRGRWRGVVPVVRRAAGRAAGRDPELAGGGGPNRRDRGRAGGNPGMIDWILAERIAGYVAGTGDAEPPTVELAPLAAESEARVVAYTGLAPARPLPPPEGISRREWVVSNITAMR